MNSKATKKTNNHLLQYVSFVLQYYTPLGIMSTFLFHVKKHIPYENVLHNFFVYYYSSDFQLYLLVGLELVSPSPHPQSDGVAVFALLGAVKNCPLSGLMLFGQGSEQVMEAI